MSLKLGLVGFGRHAKKTLVDAVVLSSSFDLAAIYSRSEVSFSGNDGVLICGSLDELLQLSELDAIYVATDNYSHFDIARAVLLSGKHLIVEKPAVLTKEHALELTKLAAQQELVLLDGFMYLYHPMTDYFIGRIGSMEEGIIELKFTIPEREESDFRISTRRGSGAFWDLAVYPLSLLQELITRFNLSYQFTNGWIRQLANGTDSGGCLDMQSGKYRFHCSWGFGLKYENCIKVDAGPNRYWADRFFSKGDKLSVCAHSVQGKTDTGKVYWDGVSQHALMLDEFARKIYFEAVDTSHLHHRYSFFVEARKYLGLIR